MAVSREAFDKAARRHGVIPRERDRAYTWACLAEQQGRHWRSPTEAVRHWIIQRLARTSRTAAIAATVTPPAQPPPAARMSR